MCRVPGWSRWLGTIGVVVVASSLVWGQGPPHQNPKPGSDPGAGAGDTSTTVAAGNVGTDLGSHGGNEANLPANAQLDQQFILLTAMRSMTQVELGKMASTKSANERIREFGQRMFDQETKATNQLKRVAGKNGIAIPAALDARHQEYVGRLAQLSGTDFDRTFVQAQIRNHEREIKDFELESQQGANPAVRKYASQQLPVLKDHLQALRTLNQNDISQK